jgi:Family of unknown function (DUF5677)
MSPKTLFTRDPREVPFLRGQLKEILELADSASRNVTTEEDDDFGFMAIQFLYKQIHHAESVLILVPRRDAGLIARTMIDGFYKLLWAYQVPKERPRLWRSFSIIEDWRLIQKRLKVGIEVAPPDIRTNEMALKQLGDLHKKPKPVLPDPYNEYWQGKIRLSDMADAVGRELYDEPYAELSDWEHWGVNGIGQSITRENNCVVVEPNSDRVAMVSLLAACQCLLSTLEVADVHLSLNITDEIQTLGKDLRETLDSFYRL